ncbi:MAG: hypothetical protein WBG86_16450 [Polyangiales bacterium]
MDERIALAALCCALLPVAATASAQGDPSTELGTSTTTMLPPNPPPVTADMLEADPSPPPEATDGLKVGFTWALQVGVPIFLDVDRDIVKAGGDVSFFGAADFDYFMLGGAAGIGWNPVKLDGVTVDIDGQPVTLSGRSPLTRLFLSIPEFRVQVPNLKVFLPYAGISFDMNFWNFRQTEVGCGAYYCSEFSVYRFTPGFTARGGLGIHTKGGIYIDAGLRYSYSGKGNFFEQKRQWLTPYVGVMIRAR